MPMRILWVMSLAVFGLLFGASLVSHPPANALVPTREIHQASIIVEQPAANPQDLPVQSFDAF